MVIALLPMKESSQRVPGKNFREIGGKPLYRWMLDTLLSMSVVERVVINTDAEQILSDWSLAKNDRIILRKRRAELCGHEVPMNRILTDDLESLDPDRNLFLMTHVTNPFLSGDTIKKAIDVFISATTVGSHDSLFSVSRVQSRFYSSEGDPLNHDPKNLIQTQDLEPWFEENSCLYLFSRDSFSQSTARIGGSPILFETPRLESIDIDTEDDWIMAEALATTYYRLKGQCEK